MSFLSTLNAICIYGMGMMGASLGFTLKKNPNFKGEIIGIVRNEKNKEWILNEGIADEVLIDKENGNYNDIIACLQQSSLLIIGLPVLKTIHLLKILARENLDILMTDISSTRNEIEQKVRIFEKSSSLKFVGSHPICGSELSGPQGYLPDLYKNKLCIIIDRLEPHHNSDRNFENFQKIKNFWQEMEMEIYVMDAKTHDEILAYLSHAPHILSSILTTIIGQKPEILEKNYNSPIPIFGGGLRDMIRIAGSNPQMWYDIISTNKQNVLNSLEHFQRELNLFLKKLKSLNDEEMKDFWFQWQTNAKIQRDRLYGK